MKTKIIYLKGSFAVALTWISNKLGLLLPALILLTVFMIIDYISGMLAAKKEALDYPNDCKYGWNSKKSIIGIYKKVGYILTITVAIGADFLIFKFVEEIGIKPKSNTIFGLLVIIWFIINELLSILENSGRMGAVLPQFLLKILSELKSEIEDK